MPDLWMPGAERRPQSYGVPLDASLPRRAVHHITWDQLGPGGVRPDMDAVAGYLERMKYCPHLLWDPFTGRTIQWYPANVGGRALAKWNEDGARNIQVEILFTPGTVYGGKKYATVADTPLKGWDRLVGWIRSHGIPDRWPLGTPQWSGNSRDRATWDAQAGHYGHSQVPDNSHTDPGPMPAFPTKKEWFEMATKAELSELLDAKLAKLKKEILADVDVAVLSYKAKGRDVNIHDTITRIDRTVAAIKAGK